MRGPIIKRVTGCNGEIYSDDITFNSKVARVSQSTVIINGFLRSQRERRKTTLPFGRSYNCRRGKGEEITLEGLNFGAGNVNGVGSPAAVEIDGAECRDVAHDLDTPQELLTCITPRMLINMERKKQLSIVMIRNGKIRHRSSDPH